MLNILPPLVVAMEIRLSYVIMCVYHALKVFHVFIFIFILYYFLASRATLHVRLLSIHRKTRGFFFFFFFFLRWVEPPPIDMYNIK